MIAFVYGTTGELIKVAPVMRRLQDRGIAFFQITTAQQTTQIEPLLEHLKLPAPDLWLARGMSGRDLERLSDIPVWMSRVMWRFFRERRRIRRHLLADGTRPTVVVHGDTFTTFLGAVMGRALRARVGHIEAGLRSFNLRQPFPEEGIRRMTSRIVHVHYAPGDWAASNLSRGDIVNTGSNTVRDSLELDYLGERIEAPFERFGIVSIHRNELLAKKELLKATLRRIREASEHVPLVFIDHPVAISVLEREGLLELLNTDRIRRVPRMRYLEFIDLMRQGSFMFTDSGGSQEEAYYLDYPCLIHRLCTERQEGLGENAILSKFDSETVNKFLSDPASFRRSSNLPTHSPSDIIVADLLGIDLPTVVRERKRDLVGV